MSDEDDKELLPELAGEVRHRQQLAKVPAAYKRNDERMALELLMLEPEDDPVEVFTRYGYEQDQALEVLQSPAFQKILEATKKDLNENGLSFKAKARAQAEDLLTESYAMARDPMVSAAVRATLIQWTAKVAGLEPRPDKDGAGSGTGGGLVLNIQFAGSAPQPVITREPITIEAER